MTIIYNILQLSFLIFFSPILLAIIATTPKYRTKIFKQIGCGLKEAISYNNKKRKTIWIHALSVGEVATVIPLVKKLNKLYPEINIIFSSTTTSGQLLAKEKIAKHTQLIFFAPFDILPITKYFVKILQPDLYVLVETDFWPNILSRLHKENIPTVLINGRISENSFNKYNFFKKLFLPLFSSFNFLCMQTENDRKKMIKLGVSEIKSLAIGNLKYNISDDETNTLRGDFHICLGKKELLIICGSTHKGEEEIILNILQKLQPDFPNIHLLIAPRNIERSAEIIKIGQSYGLTGTLRSNKTPGIDFTVLDTIGELKSLYKLADIVFIGGSLVNEGGHNPLEAAAHSVPIIFGPYMDDFLEISTDLTHSKGAIQVNNAFELENYIVLLLKDKTLRHRYSTASFNHCKSFTNTIDDHIKLIIDCLNS